MTEPPRTEPNFRVEPADPCSPDAARLIALLTEELARRYDFLDDGAGNFAPEDVVVDGAAFLIGRAGGEAVACGAFRPLVPGVAEVKRIFVAPEHRGRGYAKLLLREIERRAAACGYARLRLETGDRQHESIALYEAIGFRRIPNFGIYVGSDWSVCYEKDLTAEERHRSERS